MTWWGRLAPYVIVFGAIFSPVITAFLIGVVSEVKW